MKKLFKERLKAERTINGIGQVELSKKLGVSQAAVAKWETGDREPSFDILIKLCEFFGVSSDYLLGIKDE